MTADHSHGTDTVPYLNMVEIWYTAEVITGPPERQRHSTDKWTCFEVEVEFFIPLGIQGHLDHLY
jgi:hypothetical protein